MNEPFLDFEWYVWPACKWTEVLDQDGKPVVVPAADLRSATSVERAWGEFGTGPGPVLWPVFKAGPARPYRPMRREHAALFWKFADLDYRDREAIRGFATTYGHLGLELLGLESPHGLGESQLAWAREICFMREALELAQPATPSAEAEERAKWRTYDAQTRALWRREGITDQDPAALRRDERRRKLAGLVNRHLQFVQGRMTFEPDVAPQLTFAPRALLAAMWLQLALALAGDKQFVACKFCRGLFEISTEPTGYRSHREFCSDVCKTKDYRRRKRTALKLAAGRSSVSTIAERTNTKRATVRQWLAASKKGRTQAQKGDE